MFLYQNHPNWSCTFVTIQRIARGFDKGLVKWSRSKIQKKESNHDKVIGALMYAPFFVELPLHFFAFSIFPLLSSHRSYAMVQGDFSAHDFCKRDDRLSRRSFGLRDSSCTSNASTKEANTGLRILILK